MWKTHPTPATRPTVVREALRHATGPVDAPALSPKFRRYWHAAGPGGSLGSFQSSRRLDPDQVCPTVPKSEGYGGVYHPTEPRPLSTSERAALFSFPQDFRFAGSWKDAKDRMGNSVPPLLMKAVAENLARAPFMRRRG